MENRMLSEAIIQAEKYILRLKSEFDLDIPEDEEQHLFSLLTDGYYTQIRKNFSEYLDGKYLDISGKEL